MTTPQNLLIFTSGTIANFVILTRYTLVLFSINVFHIKRSVLRPRYTKYQAKLDIMMKYTTLNFSVILFFILFFQL